MVDEPLSRGGAKLEAAIVRFGLAARIAGARAVDVGASTGGFTGRLLEHGAAHVTAIDVGHGQLHTSLRGDPRITSLEGVDWKRLSLDVAPGPFDVFTVDVSFVAARNMLRGLAFRLRPGAEGVVLVKPQFELPPRRKAMTDEAAAAAARREALDRVRRKAEDLGFELVAAMDSPVPGGRGTIEVLAHLRFRGRSDKLPARKPASGEPAARGASAETPADAATTLGKPTPGPQPGLGKPADSPRPAHGTAATGTATSVADAGARAAGGARARRDAAALTWFAIAAPGLEGVVSDEVAALPGAAEVTRVEGGVEWRGNLASGYRANLWLRVASRVVARAGAVEARDFAPLRRRLASLPWERFLAPGTAIKVAASASRCRLYHTGGLAEAVEHAIADRLGGAAPPGGTAPHASAAPDAGAPVRVMLRGQDDRFTASVDASGELLHRRGFRQETAKAPLRETLAAGLLALCAWDPATPLVDPLCGSGTLALEACLLALRRAPGRDRAFAFERWPSFDAALLAGLRDEARAGERGAPPSAIVASDANAGAVAAAVHNAERAGVAAFLRISRARLADLQPPEGPPGLVLTNPPYGHRIGEARLLRPLYAELGRVLRERFAGWRVGILVADEKLERALGLRGADAVPLFNGGLPVRLLRARAGLG